MATLIVILSIANVMLTIALVVAALARMERRYTNKVIAEHERKSILQASKR